MQIDKNIPIPDVSNSSEVDELKKMEVGDSAYFEYLAIPNGISKLRNRLMGRARYAEPFKFSLRAWPVENPTGFRLWRIK